MFPKSHLSQVIHELFALGGKLLLQLVQLLLASLVRRPQLLELAGLDLELLLLADVLLLHVRLVLLGGAQVGLEPLLERVPLVQLAFGVRELDALLGGLCAWEGAWVCMGVWVGGNELKVSECEWVWVGCERV